ncbi:putative bifunctional diguanylate cyclase/phosphodiesterase [Rubellimicrobium aerolatum]|uniref:Bifunctional diguanylate cyclase/phosphodiesterase n=1 Tax=Rubellimicrobium aerolatum TaxID=490979 RepID=A0ABW0SG10_9RHOB|nr:bifunctional diguanylate cyclase/phosphodiesterase [Rubellimicrobium aerolatum]MBP1807343.1 diguanylate cyclase (GGDEF)-like protein [Rubellimicrobium aerolatum]
MKYLFRLARRPSEVAGLLLVLALFWLAHRADLLERFFAFSRAHEDWELDEIFSLVAVAALVAPLLLWRWNRSLARAHGETAAAQAEAQRVALHDPLTGLPNRRGLHHRLRDAARTGRALTLLLLDLDRFKPVNDLRGHDAGDELLCAVAGRLRRIVPEDALVARLGGDEFVVAAGGACGPGRGAALAEHVLRGLSEPFDFDGWSASISCSIGIADGEEGVPPPELLRRADQAMYRAKQAGRDGWARYDAALGEALRVRAALEHDLRRALAEDRITPFFQPIYDLPGRRLRGFEVLSRWNDPERGYVPPDLFIPLAEELGLIERLSEQVLDRACAALTGWPTDLPISFNLSPRQFADASLPRRVLGILDRHGLPGSRLEIEITERAVLADLEVARRIIAQLAAVGVRISLDDFGTGTSSLAILTQLPIDRIKIDRSFIAEVDLLPERGKIVSGVLALARSLGLDVTAEGIERDEELAFLAERRCALGQGFLLGRPQPAEGVAAMLEAEAGRAAEALRAAV